MDFDYRAMTIQHRGRPAVIAFDFIPPRPTTAQLPPSVARIAAAARIRAARPMTA